MARSIRSEQRQVPTGGAAGQHDAVRIDTEARGVVPGPGDSTLYVTYHRQHVCLWAQSILDIHHHVTLRRQMPEQRAGAKILLTNHPGASVCVEHRNPGVLNRVRRRPNVAEELLRAGISGPAAAPVSNVPLEDRLCRR